jgi:hypothetical protein
MAVIGAVGISLGIGILILAIVLTSGGAESGPTLGGGLFSGLLMVLMGCVSIAWARSLSKSGSLERDRD